MVLHPTWQEIAVRLLLTILAGAVIGENRGTRGHAAGLRTTILVALAASVSMVQANLLLAASGRAGDSFATLDLMRLPLGILTGVGFIGGGTILKRGDLVTGVTTAATLWVVTVIGLCMGGGQLAVGTVTTVLAFATLWALGWLDVRIPREIHALLVIGAAGPGSAEAIASELAALSGPLGFRVRFLGLRRAELAETSGGAEITFEVQWRRAVIAEPPLDFVKSVGERHPVLAFDLTPEPRTR